MEREAARYRSNIIASMKEAGMKQEELARRIGICRESLSRKMNGRSFSEDEMIAIKRVFRWETIGG